MPQPPITNEQFEAIKTKFFKLQEDLATANQATADANMAHSELQQAQAKAANADATEAQADGTVSADMADLRAVFDSLSPTPTPSEPEPTA